MSLTVPQGLNRIAVGVSPRSTDPNLAAPTGRNSMAGTYTNLLYHIIFSTKHREPVITADIEQQLHKYNAGILRNIEGICLEVGGMPDHIHILAKLPAKVSVSDALRTIKSSSSKWAGEHRAERASFGWQDGYAAFSVSTSQAQTVRRYICNQKSHHQRHDFRGELVGLLEKHGVAYDPRYIWD